MADLTANAPLRILGDAQTLKLPMDSSAANHAYKGAPMIIDQSADTVRLTTFVDAIVVDPTDVFMGIAQEEKNVASGATEDVPASEIELYVEPTIVGFKSAVFTRADLGKTVYMSDSGTLSTTVADNPQIGTLYDVRDGYAYVRLTTPQVCAGA